MQNHDKLKSTQILGEEHRLWKEILKGDEQAFETLYRIQYPFLFNYGLKLSQQEELVKDSIQEVFAYIWEKRRKLTVTESIRAYLLVSLRRLLLNALAKERKQRKANEEFTIEQLENVFPIEDMIIFQELENSKRLELKKAFEEIPARMREALFLKTYNGLAYKEIAAIMNVEGQVARNYVSDAFRRLRHILGEKAV
ncbi:RNA polymerase sigma factor [candidate division KSB1 bacterium]|nr:RNA polymerase sigma factor [candidate division KSB1 bacterium]NIR70165.1 RNA polymerase sigma factor [candidate division KSB1 bacterium]NIS27551.1 RNA polymerase sigma factor [candidate division KSB1 bacterium]NIT74404.1 RNA polymerase sigma factor [candidate division KSB1 bacterium]NIU28269.1 RNA polymerase sigma factor [candidate division KSB1 bacterium]